MSRFPHFPWCWSSPRLGACIAGAVALLVALAGLAEAQLFRGTVRSITTAIPIPEAQVTVRDSLDDVLASTVSDSAGRFTLRLRRVPTGSVIVQARRLGYEVVRTGEARIGRGDSVEVELLMTEVAATLDAITVRGMATLNEKRLADAYRRGWQVYEPERVAQHQSRAADMMQLLRSMGTPSLILPRRIDDCVRNTRTGECMTWSSMDRSWAPAPSSSPRTSTSLPSSRRPRRGWSTGTGRPMGRSRSTPAPRLTARRDVPRRLVRLQG